MTDLPLQASWKQAGSYGWLGDATINGELKLWQGHVPRYLPPVFDGIDHRRCFQLTALQLPSLRTPGGSWWTLAPDRTSAVPIKTRIERTCIAVCLRVFLQISSNTTALVKKEDRNDKK